MFPAYKFLVPIKTYSEFKRLWYHAKKDGYREGQSFWNAYGNITHSFPELFYEENPEKAKNIAWQHILEFNNQ